LKKVLMAGMVAGGSGLAVGDELGELFFQQFVLGLEAGDEAEDLLQDLAQGQTAVHGGGFAQFVEGVVLLGLVEDLSVHVVDDAVPLPGFDGGGDGVVGAHTSSNFSKNMRSIFMPSAVICSTLSEARMSSPRCS
jgi:hypothetical protein